MFSRLQIHTTLVLLSVYKSKYRNNFLTQCGNDHENKILRANEPSLLTF